MKEWFTARMSACCLAAPTYALLPGGVKAGADARAHVRELYKKLCTDDTPMVRRRVRVRIAGKVRWFTPF